METLLISFYAERNYLSGPKSAGVGDRRHEREARRIQFVDERGKEVLFFEYNNTQTKRRGYAGCVRTDLPIAEERELEKRIRPLLQILIAEGEIANAE